MNIDINDIVTRYGNEIATLTQRAVIAEAQVEALQKQLAEQSTEEPA